jgi:hypothetical protein
MGLWFGLNPFIQTRRKKNINVSWPKYLSIFLGIGLIIYSYDINWNRFYMLTFEGNKMYLQYFFPDRIKEVNIRSIKSLKTVSSRRSDMLKIEERNGKAYLSSQTREPYFGKNLAVIKEYIKVKNGFKR